MALNTETKGNKGANSPFPPFLKTKFRKEISQYALGHWRDKSAQVKGNTITEVIEESF